MKAIVFGATGLIGNQLLEILAEDNRYEKIVSISRSLPRDGPERIETVVFDFKNWEEIQPHFTPQTAVFCCIGTTRSKTPDYEEYRSIDVGIPVAVAMAAAKGNCSVCVVISSLGADKSSNNFYLSLKGEMEEAVSAQKVERIYFFRPSLLLGNRKEKRPAEWMGRVIGGAVAPLFIGNLRKYKPVHASTVAKAMANIVFSETAPGPVENDEIIQLGKLE